MAAAKRNTREIVLKVLSKNERPMTAYQILEKLRIYGINGPPTVYRALEALLMSGRVHRIESINAFIVCHQEMKESHLCSFILCEDCGDVEEFFDNRMDAIRKDWGKKLGFSITQQTVELLGLCCECKRHASPIN